MKQNNKKKTWKAIVAVMLVMASLFAVSTSVNAGLVEVLFEEELTELVTLSSSSNGCTHQWHSTDEVVGKCSTCKSNTIKQTCGCKAERTYCNTCNKEIK